MADFEVVFHSGVTYANWVDPVGPSGQPSRVNSKVAYPQRRVVAVVGTQVELRCVVGGVSAPLDTALGGRLFVPFFISRPVTPITWSSPVGQSSIQRFTPPAPGHYEFRVRRPQGGCWILRLDAVNP